MAFSAWICGLLGGACAIVGIVNAVGVFSGVAGLDWMFWFVLSAILLLMSIALSVGRVGVE